MATPLTWAAPGWQEALSAAGLDDLVRLKRALSEPRLLELAESPAPLTKARTRRLYRLPPDVGGGIRVFVKLQIASAIALPPRKWLSYSTRPSPLIREAHAAFNLGALDIKVPPIIGYGARGRFPGTLRAVLITAEVPGTIDLEALFQSAAPMAVKLASADAVEAAVKALHKKGLALGGARYRDFLVPSAGATSPSEVVFLDAAGFGRGRGLGWRKRARDLKQLQQDRARFG